MSISDVLMWRYFELLSFRPVEEIARFKHEVDAGANPRDIKFRLAGEIVARFHSAAAAQAAHTEFVARFQQGAVPDDMPEYAISLDGDIGIAALLTRCALTASNSEAHRLLEQGGVRVDGEKVIDRGVKLVAGKSHVLQVGKRKFARVHLKLK